jgi:hypothetical protein
MARQTEDEMTVDDFDHLVGILTDGVVGAISGLVGVALLTGALFLAGEANAFDGSSFATVGGLIGLDAFGPPVLVGFLLFAAHGMVTWPLLFAATGQYLPGDRASVRGMVFGAVLWFGFVPAFYSGQTGMALVVFLALSFVGHLAYGFSLGAVFTYLAKRPPQIV